MRWLRPFAALVGSLAGACAHPAPRASARAPEPSAFRISSSNEREKVAITVYNQNFGLVREVRRVPLGTGTIGLEYRDVSAKIQAETVHLRSLDDPKGLAVLEQNYRYDLLTSAKLLEKYVGKKVRLYRWNEELGREDAFDGELLSVEGGVPVLRVNGEVTFGFSGRFAFPDVPPNLIAEPTLVWLLSSDRPEQRVEVSYLTQELNWRADYVLTLDEKDEKADLKGWVTLTNSTGTSFENAELRLVAGDVQRVAPRPMMLGSIGSATTALANAHQFQEQPFFEYHLYSLDHPTTLLDKEQKQVSLLEAHGVGVEKKLRFRGQQAFYYAPLRQPVANQKVSVYLDVKNAEGNHLGMPLPKGIVRVYKADASGAEEFVGEDSIDHTPRDETLKVRLGEAFDVVVDRKQTSFSVLDKCASESAFEIEVRNHKDTAVTVEVEEPVQGDWAILESSQPYEKEDAHAFRFDVKAAARGSGKVTYRVRVRWC
jgi:hypothetical protein